MDYWCWHFKRWFKVDVEYLWVMKDCDLKCWLMLGFDSYLTAEAVPFKQANVSKPPVALAWVVEEISFGITDLELGLLVVKFHLSVHHFQIT